MNRTPGFTLIELMVTIAVASILLTLAVPSFQSMVENNSLTTQINLLVGALNGARSEAVKRGQRVSICKSNDATNCASSGGYEQGWIMFVEEGTNNPGERNPGSETLLRAGEALKPGYSLRGNGTTLIKYISYFPSGEANANGRFILCKDNDIHKSRGAVVISSGRLRQAEAAEITSCTP